jgi:poly(A) polymerase
MTEPTHLPPAPWTQRDDVAALVTALGPGQLRWVGGAVRDTLLGLAVKDIDAATPLLPDVVIERCRAAGIKTVPTGIAHGTITAVLAGGPVEITTLRRDVSTDGRHATIAFATNWHEDAARRDFTINALYADPATLVVHDYFGGLADLAARHVRFIGQARQRIAEDHLRILRYFRFQARFGSLPGDPQAVEACAALAATLKGLSRERIGMELINLLGLPDPAATLAQMQALGVLGVVLPEAQLDTLPTLLAAESAHAIAPDALRRLAAVLPQQAPVAEAVAARLRLSLAQKRRLVQAATRDGQHDPCALAYRLGHTGALDALLLAGLPIAPLPDWQKPVFPLKGGAIVARGVKAGPMVAHLLTTIETAWIAEGFPPAARVNALLDEALASLGPLQP